MPETLDQAIADEREAIGILRSKKLVREADMIETIVERFAQAAEPFTTWYTDESARVYSGKSVDYLRDKFPELEARGLAKIENGRRLYLECALPRRAVKSLAREAGRRGGKVTR